MDGWVGVEERTWGVRSPRCALSLSSPPLPPLPPPSPKVPAAQLFCVLCNQEIEGTIRRRFFVYTSFSLFPQRRLLAATAAASALRPSASLIAQPKLAIAPKLNKKGCTNMFLASTLRQALANAESGLSQAGAPSGAASTTMPAPPTAKPASASGNAIRSKRRARGVKGRAGGVEEGFLALLLLAAGAPAFFLAGGISWRRGRSHVM